MRDDFYECSASPQRIKSQKFFYWLYNILFILSIVVFAIMLYMFILLGDIPFIVLAVTSALFAVGCYFIRRKTMPFFDYTYISGEVRIIRVVNGKYRKKFAVIQCKDIEEVGKVESDSFEKLYDSTTKKQRKIATPNGLGSSNELFYIYGIVDGEKGLVVLECDEKFIAYIVAYRGRNILAKDYK